MNLIPAKAGIQECQMLNDIHLPSFHSVRALVVGDVMLDRYWHGNTSRISPEAPVPILRVTESQERPGGAGNVALNLKALGCQVFLVGIVGQDEVGNTLEKQLATAGVYCYFHRVADFPTITKLRVLGRHQQLVRLDFEGSLDALKTQNLIPDVKRLLQQKIDVLILSDYAKGTLHHAQAFINAAKEANIPVLVDPKSTDFSLYQGATVITPNQKEFEAIVGHSASEEEMVAKGCALLQNFAVSALLITRSEHGMMLLREHFPPICLPAKAREVYDVTGAGDTVIAVLAASMAAGVSLDEAAALANVAAGLAVEKLGAVTISADELRLAIRPSSQTAPTGCITAEAELIQMLEDARARNETIVMTNGCFDILHAGHVQYLEQAKKLGQRLIVAINDDDSVRRLKGKKRPINALADRMSVVAGLRSVDWVIAFSEDTPERLIELIQPHILVKGEDYQIAQIAGAEYVLANGGKVHLLPFKPNCSTSGVIQKILSE